MDDERKTQEEQTSEDWFREISPAGEVAPGIHQLAVVEIDGQQYYQDDQLEHFRHVERPWEWMTFDEVNERVLEERDLNNERSCDLEP